MCSLCQTEVFFSNKPGALSSTCQGAKDNRIAKCQNRLVTPPPTFSKSFHLQMEHQIRRRMKGCEVVGGQQLGFCYFIQLLTSANLITFTLVKHFYFVMNSTVEYSVLQVRDSNRWRQWKYIKYRVY